MENLFEYRRDLDALHFTSEQKARMMTQLKCSSQIEAPQTRNKIVIKKRFPIMLAAVIAALSITAVAAYALQWNGKLAERFGANEQQQSALVSAGAVASVEQTVTVNGLTVTALQTLGDKNGIYLLFYVKAPEGIILSDENSFSPTVNIEGAGNHVSSVGGFMHHNDGTASLSGAANERYYEVWLLNGTQEDLNGKTITVDFAELLAPNGTETPEVVLSGPWKLSWTLSYLDKTQRFEINKTYDINGHNVMVNTVELSPMSMKLNLSGDGLKQLIDDSDLDEAGSLLTPTLTLHDGETPDLYGSYGPASEKHTDTTYTLTHSFGEILDVDQVANLTLTFPWEESNNTLTVPLT